MHLEDYKEGIASSACLATVMLYLSGFLVCNQYIKNKTTGEATPFQFLFGFLSCSLWHMYGLGKGDAVMTHVNLVGAVMMMYYIFVFNKFSVNKSVVFRQTLITILTFLSVMMYFLCEEDHEMAMFRIGTAACIITTLMIGAPMSKLYYVIKSECTDCLPLPLIVMSFFVSVLWSLYGVIECDLYIMGPNLVGGLLAAVQLAVIITIHRKKSFKRRLTKNGIIHTLSRSLEKRKMVLPQESDDKIRKLSNKNCNGNERRILKCGID